MKLLFHKPTEMPGNALLELGGFCESLFPLKLNKALLILMPRDRKKDLGKANKSRRKKLTAHALTPKV